MNRTDQDTNVKRCSAAEPARHAPRRRPSVKELELLTENAALKAENTDLRGDLGRLRVVIATLSFERVVGDVIATSKALGESLRGLRDRDARADLNDLHSLLAASVTALLNGPGHEQPTSKPTAA